MHFPLSPRIVRRFLVLGILVLGLVLAGCGLTPQTTYQGRLTDQNGNPLNGTVTITFDFYDASTGGTKLYTENDTVTVTDGLFDTVLGPSSATSGLTPKDLSQPLWVEITINDGTNTETLSPRQRLYGAPYAFTLMQGSVISGTMDQTVYGANGITGILSAYNMQQGDALPVLYLSGDTALEVTGNPLNAAVSADDGIIRSQQSASGSDLLLISNDEVWITIDQDNNEFGHFEVRNFDGSKYCRIDESGNLYCTGSKSSLASIDGQQRALYAVESPGVWFEDFGSAKLQNGAVTVQLDPLFAQSINTGVEYHVFLTPLGECNGLYVANKSATGFEVRELGGGVTNVAFDYRIVAKRAGYENKRLEVIPASTGE